MIEYASELKGLKVLDGAGRQIGKVSDVQLAVQTWAVKALLVKLEKDVAQELGQRRAIGRSELLVTIDHIRGVSDAVLLRESVHELGRLFEGHAAHAH